MARTGFQSPLHISGIAFHFRLTAPGVRDDKCAPGRKQGMSKTSIGIVGAGAIGRMHADKILQSDFATLSGIADPTEAGRAFAEKIGVAWFAGRQEMLDRGKPEAAIIATPNATHREFALD